MTIDFDPSRPIWHQLVHEFRRRIVVQTWRPGARIGGVRDLAGELGVNPNTVQRALSELERDGLCRVERASGRFVTDDTERIRGLRAEMAADAADDYIRAARGFGIPLDHATALIAERWTIDDRDPADAPAEPANAKA